MNLKEYIRDIPDFPKPGILFRDITPLLANAQALTYTIKQLVRPFQKNSIEMVVGLESRGFIFGTLAARELNVGFVPIRKHGKLPSKTYHQSYDLEYGKNVIEIHQDAFAKGTRVLIVDDLLATGGTAWAAMELVKKIGGEILAVAFVIELTTLSGRRRLAPHKVHSLVQY